MVFIYDMFYYSISHVFLIGDSWPYNLDELAKLKTFADDAKFQREVMQVIIAKIKVIFKK